MEICIIKGSPTLLCYSSMHHSASIIYTQSVYYMNLRNSLYKNGAACLIIHCIPFARLKQLCLGKGYFKLVSKRSGCWWCFCNSFLFWKGFVKLDDSKITLNTTQYKLKEVLKVFIYYSECLIIFHVFITDSMFCRCVTISVYYVSNLNFYRELNTFSIPSKDSKVFNLGIPWNKLNLCPNSKLGQSTCGWQRTTMRGFGLIESMACK